MKRDSVASAPKARAKKSEYKYSIQEIRRLRREGYLGNQIAERLGMPIETYNRLIYKLTQEGCLKKLPRGKRFPLLSRKERKEREDLIVKLREDGYSYQEIFEETGLSISTISQIVHMLIQKGRIVPWARGVRMLSEEDMNEYEGQVVILREQGMSIEEIAEELEFSVSTVASIISYLLACGRIKRKEVKASWRNLMDKRVQTVIKMVKTQATLKEIGDVFGFTRERARQLIGCIKDEHGEAIFASDETIWTPAEAASELGVSANIISCICRSGEIPTRRRGVNADGAFLINEESMRMLRSHPLVTRERQCPICDKIFVFEPGSNKKQVCSEECLNERERQQREALFDQEPTLDSLDAWRKNLWQKLQTHSIPQNEKWLTITEAKRRSGLSLMQLVWLRYRSIVTIRPDPVKRWHGQPVATYAESEMIIAGKIFKDWKEQRKTKD